MQGNMDAYADATEIATRPFRVCGGDSPAVNTHTSFIGHVRVCFQYSEIISSFS